MHLGSLLLSWLLPLCQRVCLNRLEMTQWESVGHYYFCNETFQCFSPILLTLKENLTARDTHWGKLLLHKINYFSFLWKLWEQLDPVISAWLIRLLEQSTYTTGTMRKDQEPQDKQSPPGKPHHQEPHTQYPHPHPPTIPTILITTNTLVIKVHLKENQESQVGKWWWATE